MTHDQYKEWIALYLYDELDVQERRELDAHLGECSECRALLDETRALHTVLTAHTPAAAADTRLLEEARQDLRKALRNERLKATWWERFLDALRFSVLPQYKTVLGGVATVALGFFLGYLAFRPSSGIITPGEGRAPQGDEVQTVSENASMVRENSRITNVRFLDPDESDGEVEFTFDAVTPVRMKGKPSDGAIQRVLTSAMLYEQNPGVRLRSVSAFGAGELPGADSEVKSALIAAVQYDENPGVRREALKVLERYPLDKEIKRTFLHVLMNDTSSGMRIAAINALELSHEASPAVDREVLDVLKQRMATDNNDYIRVRARAVLKEMKEQ